MYEFKISRRFLYNDLLLITLWFGNTKFSKLDTQRRAVVPLLVLLAKIGSSSICVSVSRVIPALSVFVESSLHKEGQSSAGSDSPSATRN
jgi:hypothetical protein